jgi:hypothetical protein
VVAVAAGDIAVCGSNNDEATAKLIDGIPGATVLTLGDNAYNSGTLSEFNNCYGPTWGRHKARTRPAPGNHDYSGSSGAKGYYDYFNGVGVSCGRAGCRDRGYYSFNIGAWHVVAINSCADKSSGSCRPGSAQLSWLRADLAANPRACTLAYWHHPHFSSGHDKNNGGMMRSIYDALYRAGAEVVLAGHSHDYERFAPQRSDGTKDAALGIRAFVVGTGGAPFTGSSSRMANSEVFNNKTHGVLRLTLRTNGYDWKFLPIAGRSFTDSGSGSCHGKPSAGLDRPAGAQLMGPDIAVPPIHSLVMGTIGMLAIMMVIVTARSSAFDRRPASARRQAPHRRARPDVTRSPPDQGPRRVVRHRL